MRHAAQHEGITRKTALPVPMRVEDVAPHPLEGYEGITVFRCSPLLADISPATCRSNFVSRKSVSCNSCPVGAMHADIEGTTVARAALDILNDPTMDRHARAAAKHGLNCIRCLRTESTATRYIGRFRLVKKAWCISCYNREKEVVSGRNSKLAKPVKWAGIRPTVLTIEDEAGKWRTLPPIMTTGREEAERYVARCYPGSEIVECFFDGVASQPNDDWRNGASHKSTATKRAPRNEACETPIECGEVTVPDFSFPTELADLAAWLSFEWPEFKRKHSRCVIDITGRRFGKLTAIERAGTAKSGEPRWLCQCHCGTQIIAKGSHLCLGDTRSRGCLSRSDAPSARVVAPVESPVVAEPISEPQDAPTEAVEPPVGARTLAALLEAVSEPVRDLIADAISKLEAIKNPSRKVRRELGRLYEKQERRAARQQSQAAALPGIRHIAAGYVGVMFDMAEKARA